MQRRSFLQLPLGAALAAQKPKTILLRTGWQTRNIGDVCFTPAMISAIERYLPGVNVIAWMANSNAGIDDMVRRAHPRVEILHAQFGSEGKEMDPKLRDAFARANLFLYNSGPPFSYGLHERYSWDSSVNGPLHFLFAKDMGVPYGIYAQSFDRFAWPSPVLYKPVLSESAFVYTRDTNSLAYLKSLGVKAPAMDFAPDIAFHFKLRDDERANEYLKTTKLERGKFLVTMMHYAVLDRPGVKEFGEEHLRKHRAVLERWVRETGLPVLVVAEDDREIELGKRTLFDPMPEDVRRKMVIRETFWRPDEALSVYLQSRALFTMEPHSMIFSLANGIPSLHMYDWAFGRKAQMFADLGLNEWAFDLRMATAVEMGDALLAVHRNYAGALEKVKALQGRVERAMAPAFARMATVLKI